MPKFNNYNQGDMLRMQRDAEARVREMQSRSRQTVNSANQSGTGGHSSEVGSGNRNWNTSPNKNREHPPMPRQEQAYHEPEPHMSSDSEQPAQPTEPAEKGTIVGDIMGALKLDEDYLLIIGLALILINQRADTTLILAVLYLLL